MVLFTSGIRVLCNNSKTVFPQTAISHVSYLPYILILSDTQTSRCTSEARTGTILSNIFCADFPLLQYRTIICYFAARRSCYASDAAAACSRYGRFSPQSYCFPLAIVGNQTRCGRYRRSWYCLVFRWSKLNASIFTGGPATRNLLSVSAHRTAANGWASISSEKIQYSSI